MNWGNKLLLTFIAFACGMGYLIYRSVNTNFELVDKDYYKNELRYQEVIDATNSANALSSQVILEQTPDGHVILQLPEEMKNKNIDGTVFFYCAYDAAKDKNFELRTSSDGIQLFDANTIHPGNYTVRVSWSSDGKKYFTERRLTVI
jgi:hypothetical protein